jgi:gamma-glutamyl:cysteine ligase YbdK (ATP-grasp superfamily)
MVLMKFGLESEKFLFNVRTNKPSEQSFDVIARLNQIKRRGFDAKRICHEFVLHMLEFNSLAAASPLEVLQDYILHESILNQVLQEMGLATVPLGSLPLKYSQHMVDAFSYHVQNSILTHHQRDDLLLDDATPLRWAGNCAGMHVHIELESPVDEIPHSHELQDKFNMGLMLTPLIAFASSPYFFGSHQAASMRGLHYYYHLYHEYPLSGALPPVVDGPEELMQFIDQGNAQWIREGQRLGFARAEMLKLVGNKGANWNPVRWNRTWNTIELRCFDSDRPELDCAKFVWVTGAMQRMSLMGEALSCRPLISEGPLNLSVVEQCFAVSDGVVNVLDSRGISEIFQRAIYSGTRDPLVQNYLQRLAEFSRPGISPELTYLHDYLLEVLQGHDTTAERILQQCHYAHEIDQQQALEIIHQAISEKSEFLMDQKWLSQFIPAAVAPFRNLTE